MGKDDFPNWNAGDAYAKEAGKKVRVAFKAGRLDEKSRQRDPLVPVRAFQDVEADKKASDTMEAMSDDELADDLDRWADVRDGINERKNQQLTSHNLREAARRLRYDAPVEPMGFLTLCPKKAEDHIHLCTQGINHEGDCTFECNPDSGCPIPYEPNRVKGTSPSAMVEDEAGGTAQ